MSILRIHTDLTATPYIAITKIHSLRMFCLYIALVISQTSFNLAVDQHNANKFQQRNLIDIPMNRPPLYPIGQRSAASSRSTQRDAIKPKYPPSSRTVDYVDSVDTVSSVSTRALKPKFRIQKSYSRHNHTGPQTLNQIMKQFNFAHFKPWPPLEPKEQSHKQNNYKQTGKQQESVPLTFHQHMIAIQKLVNSNVPHKPKVRSNRSFDAVENQFVRHTKKSLDAITNQFMLKTESAASISQEKRQPNTTSPLVNSSKRRYSGKYETKQQTVVNAQYLKQLDETVSAMQGRSPKSKVFKAKLDKYGESSADFRSIEKDQSPFVHSKRRSSLMRQFDDTLYKFAEHMNK